MKFNKITIKNFLSVSEITYSYEGKGLVLVEGDNQDVNCSRSNGAGKSTAVVDALCWCIYGITTKGQSADAVLPAGLKGGTEVRVELLKEGVTWTVGRYRKHKEYKSSSVILRNGEDLSSSTSRATDLMIQKVVGADYKTFLYTTVLGQGLSHRFSQLTDTARKEVLDSIINVKVFDLAKKEARTRKRLKDSDCDKTVGQLKEVIKTLLRSRAELSDLLQKSKAYEKDRTQRLEELEQDLTSTQDQIDAVSYKIEERGENPYQGPYDSVGKMILKLNTSLYEKKAEAKVLRDSVSKMRAEVTSIKEFGSEHTSCPTCYQKIDGDLLEKEVESKNSKITKTQDEYDKVFCILRKTEATIDASNKKQRDLQKKIREWDEEGATLYQEKSRLDLSYNMIFNSYTSLKGEQNVYDDLIQSKKASIEEVQGHKLELESNLQALNQDCKILGFWYDTFEDIRKAVINKSLDYLNAKLADYCHTLTGGEISVSVYLDDKDKLQLDISTKGGSYASASGGEKDRVDIAMAFALHDLASTQTDFTSNILILDEIAVFVDDEGIGYLMKMVREKLRRVDSAFLITQNPVFRDYCDVTWVVSKKDGKSSLTQE